MRTNRRMLVAFSALALLAADEGSEHKIKAKDVPPAVSSAASRAYPGVKIRSWAKETEGGSTTYEASLVVDGHPRDVLYAPDGATLAVEETIAATALPAAVISAIKSHYAGSTIHSAERITKGAQLQYEVVLKKAAKKEVLLAADGKVLKEE